MKKIYLLLVIAFFAFTNMFAQTVLISPTGNGGFENGTTFAANNWTVVNSSTDGWVLGTAPLSTTAPETPGPSAGSNGAYISSTTAGTPPTWTYSQVSVIQHAFYTFTVPANDVKGTLSFKWKVGGEGTTTLDWDNMKVFLAPTSLVTPVANTTVAATYQVSGAGAVTGMYKLNFAAYNAESITVPIVPGTTYKLIFSWKSDGSTIANPPAALDEVSFISSAASNITSTTLGGLWSSPATWVGGVVPASDNVTIVDGSTVVIDQAVTVNDLTIGGGTDGILQWNATASVLTVNGNLLVSPGANLNMFTAVAAPVGTSLVAKGNVNNRGTIHAAYSGQVLNFNNAAASSTLSGGGSYVGGIINGLFFQTTGSNTIDANVNPAKVRTFALTGGTLNTNAVISLDNTAQFYGQAINQKVYEIVMTNMGTGYTSAPSVTLSAPTGTGITATAIANFDALTGTVRSITITNAGDGYRSNPTVTFAGGTPTTAATAVAVVSILAQGGVNSSYQRSGQATLTGGLPIKSEQKVGAIYTTGGGVGYTSAPAVGAALPFGYQNLITAGGSGYTTAPTVAVSGGTSLTGVTNPTFTVVVAQGKVVSVIAATGGTLWISPPTLTITGGGGTGATAAYPTNTLVTANALINNGMVSDFVITNPGDGYTAAPAIALVGGGFTTVANAPTARVGLYNLTLGFFAPSTANVVHTITDVLPTNGRINVLTMNSALGASFSSNVDLYAAAPLTLTNGVINMGASTLTASHPTYAGVAGTLTSNVSGTIKLSSPGGSVTRTFPFDAPFVVATGTGPVTGSFLTTGSTITSLTASRTAAPSGTVSPSGNPIGSRAYNLITNASAVYGTAPTVTLNWNANDALISDNPSLFVSQSASLSGPWTVRSLTTGTGALLATGNRVTATTGAGPIVPTGNDFFAWTSSFVIPPALNYAVTRTTGNTYQSIAPTSVGGDGTGTLSTATGDETAQVGINITATGFIYQGSPVIAMSIHPNGYISLNNSYYAYTAASSWDNTLSPVNNGYAGTFDANKRNVIAPFYDDLNKATPVIYYKISGTKVIAEWFNTTFFGLSGPQLFYQVVLDASDQSITFNYGNMQLYNGTQNIRYSYTSGLSGAFVQPIPQPGQVMQQQFENTTYFTHENGGTANWGANGLAISPEPRSSVKFTPGTYVPVSAPTATAPLNDEPAGAITRPALAAFPSNIAWDNGTNTSNLFTTRYATNTASPANCGGATDAKDVWFKFIAPNPSVTTRIYGSGGFVPRVSIYDNTLTVLPNCVVGTQGLIANTAASGLTVGNTYYVRVYHENTGTQATATATVSGGAVTGLTITPGTNYSNPATAFSGYSPQNQGPRITLSGGGGNGSAAAWTNPTTPTSVLPLTGTNIAVTGGSGYTSAPTVTIESPDWGITGEFGIVLFSLPENDDCIGAKNLFNLTNTSCTLTENSATTNTQGATASAEATVCGTPDDDLWYKFTAVDTKTHVQAKGTGAFDAAFQVYDGGAGAGACATKTAINCINVGGAGAVDSTTMTTIVGNTYFVRVFHVGVGSVAGETFDICVRTIPNIGCATNISPANGDMNVVTVPATIFSWTAVVGATDYDVYYGTMNPPTTIINATTNTTIVPGLLSNTLYYWYVVPKVVGNAATGCVGNVTSFTTAQTCDAPTSVSSNTITSNSANITFTGLGSSYIVEYGLAGFTPGTGATAGTGGTIVTGTGSPIALTGLNSLTLYNVYVRQDCTTGALGFSPNTVMYSFTTLLVNDNCSDAITIPHSTDPTVCTNTAGTTLGATTSPETSGCFSSSQDDDVWYSFTATSSTVIINLSNISVASGTPATSMGIGLHTACGAADVICAFPIITAGNASYSATNLTVGTVYKVRVLTSGSTGTVNFNICLTAPSITPGTPGSCLTGSTVTINTANANNNSWLPLFDLNGNLIAEINAKGNDIGLVTPSVYTQAGPLRIAPQGGAFMNRNIGISVATPPATGVDVRLYFTDAEKVALDIAVPATNDRNDIVITKVPGGCSPSIVTGGVLLSQFSNAAYGVANHYVQLNNITSFSDFFLHKGNVVLPISIEFFKGSKFTAGNFLDWKVTCTSSPTVELTLERSADGRDFKTINTQNETAARCLQSFSYTDATPLAGANYYRLKIATPDGQFRYSSIVVLLNKEKGFELISVAPNPVKDRAILTLTSAKAGKMEIIISDIAGKIVSKQSLMVIAGNNPIPLNVAILGTGTYTIAAINAEGETKTTRFVKF